MWDSADFERLTVSTSVVSLTASKIEPTDDRPRNKAVISLENAKIRIKLHGEDPTGTEGILLAPNSLIHITGVNDLKRFRAILASGEPADAILNVQYMK